MWNVDGETRHVLFLLLLGSTAGAFRQHRHVALLVNDQRAHCGEERGGGEIERAHERWERKREREWELDKRCMSEHLSKMNRSRESARESVTEWGSKKVMQYAYTVARLCLWAISIKNNCVAINCATTSLFVTLSLFFPKSQIHLLKITIIPPPPPPGNTHHTLIILATLIKSPLDSKVKITVLPVLRPAYEPRLKLG